MANICIAMLPEPGHYLPTLRLAHSLRDAGNAVCYVTLAHFEEFFRRQGFATRKIEIPKLPEHGPGEFFGSHSIKRAVTNHLKSQLMDSNLQLSDFIHEQLYSIDTDLLICDMSYRKFLGLDVSRPESQLVFINVALPNSTAPGKYPEWHELILCPYEFEIPGAGALPTNRIYGEPSIYRRRQIDSFPWSILQRDRLMVYCSFGSQAAGYSSAVNAFRSLGETFAHLPAFQFVLVMDVNFHATLPHFPDNVVVAKSAPQLELLERAAAFVTHGGLGSIKEAILARVPMIVIPFAADQPANAKRVEYHKLGYA